MSGAIRVLLFNRQAEEAKQLRTGITSVPNVRVVADTADLAELNKMVEEHTVDVLLLNLDPSPEPIIKAAEAAYTANSEIAMIGICGSTDADLLMSAMRAGMRDIISNPIEQEQLASALGDVTPEPTEEGERGKLICVVGSVGGVGTTTIATNLSIELAALVERRVGLVDLQLQFGQAAIMLDILPQYTITDVMSESGAEEGVIRKAVAQHDLNVDVLARPHHFEQVEEFRIDRAIGVISTMQRMYPYVVLDGPADFDRAGRQILQMADTVILVMQLLVPCVRNVTRIFQEYERHGLDPDSVMLIVNRMGIYSKLLDMEQAENTIGRKIAVAIPDDWAAVSEAVNLGEPLRVAASKSKVYQSISGIAQGIHTGQAIASEAQQSSTWWRFGRG
jgi:pilus assembly protein CpaE